jgi:hypothetical protein
MTEKEALLLLNAVEGDYLPDNLEAALFEIKKYLTTKPVVSKLYETQGKKLERLNEAAKVLSLDVPLPASFSIIFHTGEVIIDAVLEYERCRSEFRTKVMVSGSPVQILELIKRILEIHSDYIAMWPEFHGEISDTVIMGREPDVMELLADLRSASERGIHTFDEMDQESLNGLDTFLNEWKRVSLLRLKEREWKTSSEN